MLIARGPLSGQLTKIINLPPYERVRAFTLLVALFGIADERRRTLSCAGTCRHAWHHLEDHAGEAGPPAS